VPSLSQQAQQPRKQAPRYPSSTPIFTVFSRPQPCRLCRTPQPSDRPQPHMGIRKVHRTHRPHYSCGDSLSSNPGSYQAQIKATRRVAAAAAADRAAQPANHTAVSQPQVHQCLNPAQQLQTRHTFTCTTYDLCRPPLCPTAPRPLTGTLIGHPGHVMPALPEPAPTASAAIATRCMPRIAPPQLMCVS
jgi:hypothetical protein